MKTMSFLETLTGMRGSARGVEEGGGYIKEGHTLLQLMQPHSEHIKCIFFLKKLKSK